MQTKLDNFLGLNKQDSDIEESDLNSDLPQQGNHYWTGVKTEYQFTKPGISDYELMAEILTLQYSKDYSKVAN